MALKNGCPLAVPVSMAAMRAAASDQQRERAMRPGGQTEVEGEAVAGAGGHNGQGGGGADERLGDFVHRAVSADRDHPVATVVERRPGQLGGVAGARGENEIGVEPVDGDEFPDGGYEPGTAAVPAGTGIEDEAGFHAAVAARRRGLLEATGRQWSGWRRDGRGERARRATGSTRRRGRRTPAAGRRPRLRGFRPARRCCGGAAARNCPPPVRGRSG